MSRIFAKSPYIISINESGQIGAKVEIYLKQSGGSYGASPDYTLSKLIASSNAPTCYFDVSEYISNYITHPSYTANVSTFPLYLPNDNYCYARIKRYKLIGSTYTLIDSTDYTCLNGYTFSVDGINQGSKSLSLTNGTYYYDPEKNAGDFVYDSPTADYYVRYTNLVSGANQTSTLDVGLYQLYKVYSSYLTAGNKVEIFTNTNTLLFTLYFKPTQATKYSSVTVDFLNSFGAFQREFFFGASVDSMNVSNSEYKSYRLNETTFNSQENLVQTFNVNGTESIKVNSGWVDEAFKETIKQLLLSDRILVNNRPAKLNTKQIDLQKNINNKMINYPLEFNFTNDII